MKSLKSIQKTSIVAAIVCGGMFGMFYLGVCDLVHRLGNGCRVLPGITCLIVSVASSSGWLSFLTVAGILVKDLYVKEEHVLLYNFICVTCALLLTYIFCSGLWLPFVSCGRL